jgi:monoterpene epsilon-lactone hydrolase
MLTRTGVAAAARLYACSLDVHDPRVSPLFGDMHGLPPMTVLVSSSELLYPDSLRLAEKARRAGVPVDLHVADGLPHAYPVLAGTPESTDAVTTIADAARNATRRTPTG